MVEDPVFYRIKQSIVNKNIQTLSINMYLSLLARGISSDKNSVLFQNICVLCNLGLHIFLCLLCQLDQSLFLVVAQFGLGLPLLLQGGCDGLVLPANLVCQTTKEGKLQREGERKKKKKIQL